MVYAGASRHDVVLRQPTFSDMSRAQLIQKSHANASLLEIRDRALPGLTAAQCRAALEANLGLNRRAPRQRIALCRKHLAANPGDVITSAGICSHFALNPEEALSALTALEQGEFPPEVKLRPLYPGVPLGPLSAVTGVTKRILSNLRPPRQGRGSSGRNDWWKDTFKQSRDFRVWSAMRAEVGTR